MCGTLTSRYDVASHSCPHNDHDYWRKLSTLGQPTSCHGGGMRSQGLTHSLRLYMQLMIVG